MKKYEVTTTTKFQKIDYLIEADFVQHRNNSIIFYKIIPDKDMDYNEMIFSFPSKTTIVKLIQ